MKKRSWKHTSFFDRFWFPKLFKIWSKIDQNSLKNRSKKDLEKQCTSRGVPGAKNWGPTKQNQGLGRVSSLPRPLPSPPTSPPITAPLYYYNFSRAVSALSVIPRYSLRSTIFDFHSKIFDLRMRIFDPLGGLRPPELVRANSDGASQNTNQIQLRFRRASNIDFCRTSLAIVKVLGGQGDHFGTNLGPKWHHVGVIFVLFGTLGRLQCRFFF